MSLRNDQITVASATKAINNARLDGKMDNTDLFLFQTFDYYLDFIKEAQSNGYEGYDTIQRELEEYTRRFTYNNSSLCNYKLTTASNIPNTTSEDSPNTAPTVTGTTLDLGIEDSYTFSISDFTTGFSDAEGDSYKNVIIYPAGIAGVLTFKGNIVTDVLEFEVTDSDRLIYTRVDETSFTESLPFRVSDDNLNSLFSSIVNNTIEGDYEAVNQPPTIGDNTIYVDNRVRTVLTLAMFTSQLKPPYNDPEGDLIDAIRIDSISSGNLGVLEYNSVPVIEGAIISREDLIAELFVHIGDDVDTISSDVFSFSARDEGSGIWVD